MNRPATSDLPYGKPWIHDYGSLSDMTASHDVTLAGAGIQQLTLSTPPGTPGPGPGPGAPLGPDIAGAIPPGSEGLGGAGTPGGAGPGTVSSGPLEVSAGGAGGSPSGGGGAAGGGGASAGALPFTGFAAGAVAAIGAAAAATGAVLRRAVRRRP